MKFKIYAPSYSAKIGGVIALHKLCDLLNRRGHEAVLYPLLPTFELSISSIAQIHDYIETFKQASQIKFDTNPEFNTPVITPHVGDTASDDEIVVYPDVVVGNPLAAKNVVRWFLHYPGFHKGKISYSPGELHFLYGAQFQFEELFGTHLSDNHVTITHIPFQLYNKKPTKKRTKICYCIKKGRKRNNMQQLVDHIEANAHIYRDAICIDHLAHEEIAELFLESKEFYSFDDKTLYSTLAAVAGCKSIIVPTADLEKSKAIPDPERSQFIYYGSDDISAKTMSDADRATIIQKFLKANDHAVMSFEAGCAHHFIKK